MIQGRGLWALNCLRWAQTVDHFGCRIWGSGLHCVVVLRAHLYPEPTGAKHKIKDPGSSIARRTGRTATTAFVLLCCSTCMEAHISTPDHAQAPAVDSALASFSACMGFSMLPAFEGLRDYRARTFFASHHRSVEEQALELCFTMFRIWPLAVPTVTAKPHRCPYQRKHPQSTPRVDLRKVSNWHQARVQICHG